MATKHSLVTYKQAKMQVKQRKYIGTEDQTQQQIFEYLKLQYPKLLDIVEFSYLNGVKLTIGQAVKAKKMGSGRAFPDLRIYLPKTVKVGTDGIGNDKFKHFCGLFLELKREGTLLYKKDGELRADKHVVEQANKIKKLKEVGYYADFACGFYEARAIIDKYLRG